MRWWWSSSLPRPSADSSAETQGTSEAQQALATIFRPRHTPLAAATAASSSPATEAGKTLSGGGETSATSRLCVSIASLWKSGPASQQTPATLSKDGSGPSTSPSSNHASEASSLIAWDALPPSPVAGYILTADGVVDTLQHPPRPLSRPALLQLIGELAKVEQQAKQQLDEQFGRHMGHRGHHGIHLFVSPVLFLTALYLMTWRTARLYRQATPQQSVVFTRLLSMARLHLPTEQREAMAQRHRRWMQATNAQVALSFVGGSGLFAVAWVTRPAPDVLETAPDVIATKQMVAYQRHTEASLKWCWYVYYHHPAYATVS